MTVASPVRADCVLCGHFCENLLPHGLMHWGGAEGGGDGGGAGEVVGGSCCVCRGGNNSGEAVSHVCFACKEREMYCLMGSDTNSVADISDEGNSHSSSPSELAPLLTSDPPTPPTNLLRTLTHSRNAGGFLLNTPSAARAPSSLARDFLRPLDLSVLRCVCASVSV
jgi:hypothetical protein